MSYPWCAYINNRCRYTQSITQQYLKKCLIKDDSNYEGKSLNNRNFILKCMEKYAQWKTLFWDTKWLPSNMPYRRRDDRAVWACAVGRTTWPLDCQLAPWKSNEALFIFCGQRVCETFWNLQKNEGSVCRQLCDFQLFGPMKEHLRGHKFADGDEVMEAVRSWLEATPRKLFSRGCPQVCGQVDRVCCEAGGLCRKIRHRQFL